METVFTQPDIELSLTENAVLLTRTSFFHLLTLIAAYFSLGRHKTTLALRKVVTKVPLVTCNKVIKANLNSRRLQPRACIPRV